MKNCPVCNTQVEDLYTGLCPNSLCSWEFEFISSEMTPELQKRYAEKLAKCRHLYELNIASDKRISTLKDKKKEEEKKDYDIEELRDKNRIELKFIALNELNNVKEAVLFNKYNWFYGGDLSNKLWLNLDNWTIYSDRGQIAHITEWKVNQNAHSMVLGQDAGNNYQKIDLPFAMAMLGQLVSREDLVCYLKQLPKEFIRVKETS